MSTLEAKVKSVLSGDTIILHNINNPKQERTLSLAFVTAPRLRREGDEVRRLSSLQELLLYTLYLRQCG
jgi:staphylococcal nuclease domain-containing protein 1